jgi:hypothetical protein
MAQARSYAVRDAGKLSRLGKIYKAYPYELPVAATGARADAPAELQRGTAARHRRDQPAQPCHPTVRARGEKTVWRSGRAAELVRVEIVLVSQRSSLCGS